jgi:iron(III) transport system substrate-binding protein
MTKARAIGFLIMILIMVSQLAVAADSSIRERMIEQAKKEGQVVWMGNLADELRRGLKGFRERYPFIEIKAIDARASQTTNRVVIESRARKLSVDASDISPRDLTPLIQRDVLAKYEFPHLKDFAPEMQPPSGLYVVYGINPNPSVGYNTQLMDPNALPKSWDELLVPKWKGKLIVTQSRRDYHLIYGWLKRKDGQLNWDYADDLLQKIKALDPVLGGAGHNTHMARVAAGEFAFFPFVSAGTVARLALNGAPVGIITFPKAFADLHAAVIYKYAPHPASAWLLVDYLTSPEGQFEYSDVVNAELPVSRKAKPGRVAQWMLDQGLTPEVLDMIPPEELRETWDPKLISKAGTMYQKTLGYRK